MLGHSFAGGGVGAQRALTWASANDVSEARSSAVSTMSLPSLSFPRDKGLPELSSCRFIRAMSQAFSASALGLGASFRGLAGSRPCSFLDSEPCCSVCDYSLTPPFVFW